MRRPLNLFRSLIRCVPGFYVSFMAHEELPIDTTYLSPVLSQKQLSIEVCS